MPCTNIRVKWKTFYVILHVIQEKAAVITTTTKKKLKNIIKFFPHQKSQRSENG